MKELRYVLWFLVSFSICETAMSDDWLAPPHSTSHPCQRPCVKGKVMTCYYKFNVEWWYALSKACYDCPNTLADCYRPDCVTVDGVARTVNTVNRTIPGPEIEVCLGDKIVVDVANMMNDMTMSIHWHGHHQVKSPYMDGVPFVTQCPITPNTVFRYTIMATNDGTHFWHAHTGVIRDDGVFGSLVVRNPFSEGEKKLYDEDLSEHTIIFADWTHVTSKDKLQGFLQGRENNFPDSIIVNGKGRYYKDTVKVTNTPLAVFTVKKGHRYRFRTINAGVEICPIELYIDDHMMNTFATDGVNFHPVKVDSLVTYAGERWDFVLTADQPVGNYWIRFTGLLACDERFSKAHQVAVLHYEGAPKVEPTAPVGYNLHPKPKLQLNPVNTPLKQPGTISVPLLKASSKSESDPLLHQKPDKQIYLPFDFNPLDHPVYHRNGYYGFNQVNETYKKFTPQFNHVSNLMPHSPLLSQYNDIDPKIYCYAQKLDGCESTFCECTYVIDIPLHSRVELILIDQGKNLPVNANHPFHFHGYSFRVLGMDRLGESTDVETVKKLDKEGKLFRNLIDPPYKDTVTVPDGGYTIVRFLADNPGYWILHCHIELHMDVGMAVIFKIGEPKDFPPIPKGFPKCGNFLN